MVTETTTDNLAISVRSTIYSMNMNNLIHNLTTIDYFFVL